MTPIPGALKNPGLGAIYQALNFAHSKDYTFGTITKVQPPDGLVMVLPDGTRWGISAYRLDPMDEM